MQRVCVLRRAFGLIAAAMMCLSTAAARGDEPATAEVLAQWIRDLDDESFSVREAAGKGLLRTGPRAVPAVAAAAKSHSPEVIARAVAILHEWSTSFDVTSARAARAALTELAEGKHPAAADRARAALRMQRNGLLATLIHTGARTTITENRLTAVYFDGLEDLGNCVNILPEFPELEHVSLSTSALTDERFAALQGLPNLKELNLFQSQIGDESLKLFKTFPKLRRVPMGKTQVTDRGLTHLKDLKELEYIGLRGNAVTDAGLVHLKNLTNLTGLNLGETKVTDAGLEHLQALTKLNRLVLNETKVSDRGLRFLQKMSDLQDLELSGTDVTESGVAELKKWLPGVDVALGKP